MPTQNDRHTISDLYQMQSLPLEIKVRMTQRRIRDWVEYWGEDGVYVSFSGGKDSTVLLDICRRMYPNIVAVYSDTGLEFPEIREFVKTKDNVVWVRPELTFRKVIEKCGYPCISKEQAEWIHRIRLGQKNTRDIQKYFYGIRTNGQPSRFKISERWKFMLNAPFDIGAGCCNEMKRSRSPSTRKRPAAFRSWAQWRASHRCGQATGSDTAATPTITRRRRRHLSRSGLT